MVLICMCGISGSGKSTVARTVASEFNAVYLSSDEIRYELFGDENCQEHNDEVFNLMHQRVKFAIKMEQNIVYDATNLSVKNRRALLDLFKGTSYQKIINVMNTPLHECIDNDRNRERVVGEDVIRAQACRFVCPQHYEGWNIIRFENDIGLGTGEEYDGLVPDLWEFDQKNPHHRYTLGKHCYETARHLACVRGFDEYKSQLIQAAYIHDIGKMFTQTFDKEGIAHYYNHENASAYYFLTHPDICCFSSLQEFLDIMFIVNNHMTIRRIRQSERSRKKHIKLWGQELFDVLCAFNDADDKEQL